MSPFQKFLCVIAVLVAALLLLASVAPLQGQQPRGVVIEPARGKMVADWGARAGANEHAYCITRWALSPPAIEQYLYVIDVEPSARDSSDNPNQVTPRCAPWMPVVHTHLPSTCRFAPDGTVVTSSCKYGGLDAWLCSPSAGDLGVLTHFHLPFGVVQCDRNAFVFFYNPLANAPPPL